MSKIFELFGYRLNDASAQASHSRANALCPFMRKKCDGGGNRHLSNINLTKKAELRQRFNELDSIASGVCSPPTPSKRNTLDRLPTPLDVSFK